MKRLVPLFIMIFIACMANAQNQVDALRYSQTYAGGTARSVAMGGAFGALGGDFASVSQNPAGLGVYRSSELTFTPELYYSNTSSRYLGTNENDYKYNFNINNFGYVSAFGKKSTQGFAGGAFAVGFNRLNNFSDNIRIQGNHSHSSLAESYIESANTGSSSGGPVSLDYLEPFSEWLFYDSRVMDQDSNGYYYLNPAMESTDGSLDLKQLNTIRRSGKINEWVFSAGFNFGYKLYFGATFGILPLDYSEISTFSEFPGTNSTQEYYRYYESLDVHGTGYTGKFGVIVKPIAQLRIGAAIHLPTAYDVSEVYNANIRSLFESGTKYPLDEYGNPIDNAQYDYRIVTPAKYIGSLGIILGKSLILSTDVEYIDYASMRLRDGGDGYDFSTENQTIDEIYRKNFNVKSGAEFRFNNIYLRGGFDYYGSPYQTDEPNNDAYRLSYSGGLGIRNDRGFVDFTMSYTTGGERFILYSVANEANPVNSELDFGILRSMITFGIKF
jgi:hypothetical protein